MMIYDIQSPGYINLHDDDDDDDDDVRWYTNDIHYDMHWYTLYNEFRRVFVAVRHGDFFEAAGTRRVAVEAECGGQDYPRHWDSNKDRIPSGKST